MSTGQRGAAAVNEIAASFRADMRRAGFAPEEAAMFLWALDKPADAELTVTELDLMARFETACCRLEEGAR